MNNIHTTQTSVFLEALQKDKSQIAKIDPIVVFRRILCLGEMLDTSSVYAALRTAADRCGKLTEMQKNIVDKAFVGEVISFDIGADPSWCKFKIVREPLPDGSNHSSINFIVSVTDRPRGKSWNRLVGAIRLEADKDGKNVPVFRTISDIIEEIKIEKPVNDEAQSHDLQQPPEKPVEQPEPAAATESVEPKVVFSKGDKLVFSPDKDNELKGTLTKEGSTEALACFEDPEFKNMRDSKSKTYAVEADITEEDIKAKKFQIWENLSLISEELWPDPDDEIVIETGDVIVFKKEGDVLQFLDKESGDQVYELTDPNVAEFFLREGNLYTAKEDLSIKFFKTAESLSGVIEKFDISLDPEYEVVIHADEVVEREGHPGREFRALKDITKKMLKGDDVDSLFEIVPIEEPEPQPEEKPVETEPENKENKDMGNNEANLLYKEGEVIELAQFPGKKFRAKENVTVDMINENNGDVTEWLVEVGTDEVEKPAVADLDAPPPPPAEEVQEPAKPIGDIPTSKLCKDEHSARDYMNMLFGTPAPTILHVLNELKKCQRESPTDEFALTKTAPIEQMICYSNYTFSIIRMHNGAFYRIFVAHTDIDRGVKGTWLNSHDEPDRWFCIGNVQDNDQSRLNRNRSL